MRRDVGSIPTRGAKEVITMRGSRIAKEIEQQMRREEARKEKLKRALLLKQLMKRGESNGEQRETKNV